MISFATEHSYQQEIIVLSIKINILAQNKGLKEINKNQGALALAIEKDAEFGGIGMGVLSDGTPYLNQRGLAALCGVQNAHIGTISSQWNEPDQKPRIKTIKALLEKTSKSITAPHVEIVHAGRTHYCYPSDVCLAILEYYAFDAGANISKDARDNFRLLAGSKLKDLIYTQLGYDPSGKQNDKFKKWHERLALNYQSAPKGYFHVFNEAHTIIYELIMAGADINENFVVDISIGMHWSKHWLASGLAEEYDVRQKYPHRYPDDHPQAKSNPQESWCYPIGALGDYRIWLQDEYLEGGKFKKYLQGKVKKGSLPISMANLALTTLTSSELPQLKSTQ